MADAASDFLSAASSDRQDAEVRASSRKNKKETSVENPRYTTDQESEGQVDSEMAAKQKRKRRRRTELRGLGFWSWDRRIDQHPPGKAYQVDEAVHNDPDGDGAQGRTKRVPRMTSHLADGRQRKKKGRRRSEADNLRVWAWDPLLEKYPPGSAYKLAPKLPSTEKEISQTRNPYQDSDDDLPLERLVQRGMGDEKEASGTYKLLGSVGLEISHGAKEMCDKLSPEAHGERACPGQGHRLLREDEQSDYWESRALHMDSGGDRIPLPKDRMKVSSSAGSPGVIIRRKTKSEEDGHVVLVMSDDSNEEVPLRMAIQQAKEKLNLQPFIPQMEFEDTGVEIEVENRQLPANTEPENDQDASQVPIAQRQKNRHRKQVIFDDSEPQVSHILVDPSQGESRGDMAKAVHTSESPHVPTIITTGTEVSEVGVSSAGNTSSQHPSSSSDGENIFLERVARHRDIHYITGDPTRGSTEVYNQYHVDRLGTYNTPWELNVDGCDANGERIYDEVDGLTCHQCRQKTLARVTICRRCHSEANQFCGDCLWRRYGENLDEALNDPKWYCPLCRDICNCSLCRASKGWPSTGQLYRKALRMGYASVAHYLVLTRSSPVDPNAEPIALPLPELGAMKTRRRRVYARRNRRSFHAKKRDERERNAFVTSPGSSSQDEESDDSFVRSDKEELSEHSLSSLERTKKRNIGGKNGSNSPGWEETLQRIRSGRRTEQITAEESQRIDEDGIYTPIASDSDDYRSSDFIRGDDDDLSEHSDRSHERTRGPKERFPGDAQPRFEKMDVPVHRSRRATGRSELAGISIHELIKQRKFKSVIVEGSEQEEEESDSGGMPNLTRIQHHRRARELSPNADDSLASTLEPNAAKARPSKCLVSKRIRENTRPSKPDSSMAKKTDNIQLKPARHTFHKQRRKRRTRQLHLDEFLTSERNTAGFYSDWESDMQGTIEAGMPTPFQAIESPTSFAIRRPRQLGLETSFVLEAPLLIIETKLMEAAINSVQRKTKKLKEAFDLSHQGKSTSACCFQWLLRETILGQQNQLTGSPSRSGFNAEWGCQDKPSHLHSSLDGNLQAGLGDISDTGNRDEQSQLIPKEKAKETNQGTNELEQPCVALTMYRNWPLGHRDKLLTELLRAFQQSSAALNALPRTEALPPIEVALWHHVINQFLSPADFWRQIETAFSAAKQQIGEEDTRSFLRFLEYQWEVVSFVASLIHTTIAEQVGEAKTAWKNWTLVSSLLKQSLECAIPRYSSSELDTLLVNRCQQLGRYWAYDICILQLLWDMLQRHGSLPSGCKCCNTDSASWPSAPELALEELALSDQIYLDQRSPCGLFFQMLRDHLKEKRGSALLKEASRWMALLPNHPSIVHSVAPCSRKSSIGAAHMTPACFQHYAQLVVLLYHFLPQNQGRKLLKCLHNLIIFLHSSPRACRSALKALVAFGLVFLTSFTDRSPSAADVELCGDIDLLVRKWMEEFQQMLDATRGTTSYDTACTVASLATAIAPVWSLALCLNVKLRALDFDHEIWQSLRRYNFEVSLHYHVRQFPLRCIACLYSEPLVSVVTPALTALSLEHSLFWWISGAVDEMNDVTIAAAEVMRRVPSFGSFFFDLSFAVSKGRRASLAAREELTKSIFVGLSMKPALTVKIFESLVSITRIMNRGIKEAMFLKKTPQVSGLVAGLVLRYCSRPLMSFNDGALLVRGLLVFLRFAHTRHFSRCSSEVFLALPSVIDALVEGEFSMGTHLQVLLDIIFGVLESASVRPSPFEWSDGQVIVKAFDTLGELASMMCRNREIHEYVVESVVPWFLQVQIERGNAKVGVPSMLLVLKEMLFAWERKQVSVSSNAAQPWGMNTSVTGRAMTVKTAASLFQAVMLPLLRLLEDSEANDINEAPSTAQARVSIFDFLGHCLLRTPGSYAPALLPTTVAGLQSKIGISFLESITILAVQTLLNTAVRKAYAHAAFTSGAADRLAKQRHYVRQAKERWSASGMHGSVTLQNLGAEEPPKLERTMLPAAFSLAALEHRAYVDSRIPQDERNHWHEYKTRRSALVESSGLLLRRIYSSGTAGHDIVAKWIPSLVAGAELDPTIASHVRTLCGSGTH